MADARGQASVELVAALPALLLAALVALQLLAAGYAMTLADGAAEAGALALASGDSAAAGRTGGAARVGAGRCRGLGCRRRGVGAVAATFAFRGGGRPARCQRQRQREAGAVTVLNPLDRGATVLVSAVGEAEGARAAAAALACAGADPDRAAIFIDVGGRPPRPTLLASAPARELEERLVAHLPAPRVAARGQVCHLALSADAEGFAVAAAAETVAREAVAVLHVPSEHVQALLADPLGSRLTGALLRADLAQERPLVALAVSELRGRGLAVGVLKRRLRLGGRAPRPVRDAGARRCRRAAGLPDRAPARPGGRLP